MNMFDKTKPNVGDKVYDVRNKRQGTIRKIDQNDKVFRYLVRYKDGTLCWTNGAEWVDKKDKEAVHEKI